MQAANSKEDLVEVFRDNEHAIFLLYETGAFKKSVLQSDTWLTRQILGNYKMESYTSWAAILQPQQGLRNLDVLSMIKTNFDKMKDFFCFKPPNLTSSMI